MRKTYEIGGEKWVCRTPDASDLWALYGKLPVLPTVTRDDAERIAEEVANNPEKMVKSLEFSDKLLLRCGIAPKFIAESPAEIPYGCQPIAEVDPFVRLELATALLEDGKFRKEEAQAIRPPSETSAG